MSIYLIIPILMGAGLSTQTAINTRLRGFVGSPFLATAISFFVGTILLTIMSAVNGDPMIPSAEIFIQNPWWIWIGGLLGAIQLTMNVVMFQKLGSVRTAVLPLFGQILMGILIDSFGWFRVSVIPLTAMRTIGLLLAASGVLLSNGKKEPDAVSGDKEPFSLSLMLWSLAGIGSGMLGAIQTSVNGQLGLILGSSVDAARVSFTTGTVILFVMALILVGKEIPTGIASAFAAGRRYWWIWIGGLIGAMYVFMSSWLAPKIGIGQLLVTALCGQLTASAVIEHFGLLESNRKKVRGQRIIGLVIIFVGVLLLHI